MKCLWCETAFKQKPRTKGRPQLYCSKRCSGAAASIPRKEVVCQWRKAYDQSGGV